MLKRRMRVVLIPGIAAALVGVAMKVAAPGEDAGLDGWYKLESVQSGQYSTAQTSDIIPVRVVESTSYKFTQLLAGPEKPDDFNAWLAGVRAYRQEITRPVKDLLRTMRRRAAIRLSELSSEWKVLPQRMVEIQPTRPVSRAPEGMVRIPAGKFNFEVEGE